MVLRKKKNKKDRYARVDLYLPRIVITSVVRTGVPFPKNFLSMAKTILKRLFRVYAHIYHQHFPEVVQLGEEAHLNTSFKHFIFFVQVTQILIQLFQILQIHIGT